MSTQILKNSNRVLLCRVLAGLIFIYIFVHLTAMSNSDWICHFFRNWILNSCNCVVLYLILNLAIFCYLDKYIGALLFIIIITQYRVALKEFFDETGNSNTSNTIVTSTTLSSTTPDNSYGNILDIQQGIDDRFKIDDVVKDQILLQINSQIEFDPYKSALAKDVINEIYNKYYDNNIFKKLKGVVDDSQAYIASGNFNYLPKNNQIDYDIPTYQQLNMNSQFGVNPIVDGIGNKTRNAT